MAIKKFNAVAGFSVGDDVVIEVIDNVANVNANNLSVTGVSQLGSNANVKITGGAANYILKTDGTGNLSWQNPSSVSVSGSNTQVQFNNNGSFGSDANFTYDTTTDTLGVKNITIETTGSVSGGNLVSATYLTGTLTTAAQPNITSVGTLSSLTVGPNSSIILSGTAGYLKANTIQGIDSTTGITMYYGNVSGAVGVATNLTVGTAGVGNLVVNGSVTGNLVSNGTVNFTNASNVTLGAIGNLHISGGSSGYVLKTDGAGNLSWGIDTTAAGGSNTQVQFNDNASLSGSANFTFDKTTNTLSVTNITANGAGIAYINGANVNGQVGNALVAGTVYTNAQPNITSVGTLSGLTVSGNTTLNGNVTIDGTLANLSVSNLSVQDNLIDLSAETTGTPSNNAGLRVIRGDELSVQLRWNETAKFWQFTNDGVNYFNIVGKDTAGNIAVGNANLGNLATANYFSGNGSLLTGIVSAATASNVSNGTSNVNIPTSSGNVTVSVGGVVNVAVITTTGINVAGYIAASGNLTSGNASLGNLATANYFSGSGNLLSNIQGANVSGTVANANYAAYAGNVINAAQSNITSIGTLSSLTVNGVSTLGPISNVKITGGSAGYAVITDGTGNLSWSAVSSSGTGFTNITRDAFTGNGVQTTFNLTSTPTLPHAVQVVIGGLVQLETSYTVSGSTIVFSTAPLNGQKIEVTTYGVVGIGSNTGEVPYTSNGNFVGSNSFTFNSTTNTLSVTNVTSTGNVSAGNIKTDTILYANGSPYVFTTNPAGSNTQIQFNDNGIFGATANLTFNKTTNTLSTYNIVAANSMTVTNGTVVLGAGTIAVTGNAAGIFNSGVANINLGLAANVTIGSSTGNVTVQGNLIVGNTTTITNLKVNDFYSNRTPISVTANTVVDSFSVNKYRSAKYTMRVNSDDGYQAVEVLLIHDNSTSYVTIYGSLSTIGTDIVSLSTDINSGNVRLLATTGSANTTVNLLGTYIAD